MRPAAPTSRQRAEGSPVPAPGRTSVPVRLGVWLALALIAAAGAQSAEAPPGNVTTETLALDGRRLDTGSFLFARYSSRNASVLYAGMGFGKAGMFFGIVQNPRSGYRELLAGGMTTVAWPRQSLTLGLAAADTSDGDFAQLYVVPSLSWGALSFDGTMELYEPLEREGVRQLELNPLGLFWRLGPRWSAGASYVGSFAEGSDPRQRGGPAVRLEIPHGTLEVEYLAGLQSSADELRTAVRAGF